MSAGGKDWEAALGRLTRARFKAAAGLAKIERAQALLVEGEVDAAIYAECQSARHELDMASAMLRELGVQRGLR